MEVHTQFTNILFGLLGVEDTDILKVAENPKKIY